MFDLYFVGTQNKEHDEYMIKKNCSRLFSYAEKPFYTIKRYLEHPNKLFIDSGAFSIANKVRRGKNLTIDDFTFEAKVDAFAKKNVTKLVKVVVDGEEKELSEEVVVSITADKVEHTVEFIYE